MTIDYDKEVSTVLELAYAVTNIEIDPAFHKAVAAKIKEEYGVDM